MTENNNGKSGISSIDIDNEIKPKNNEMSHERKKKIKAGLFWGLAIVGVATVLTIALTIKKTTNSDYRYWNPKLLINKQAQGEWIFYDKNKKLDVDIKSTIHELIFNKKWNETSFLKQLDFKNLKSDEYDLEIHNVIHNTVNNSICLDCLFVNKQNKKEYKVLKNVELKNFLPNSKNEYKVTYNDKKRLYALESVFFGTKLSFTPIDKTKSIEKYIKEINAINDLWIRSELFQQIFLNNFKEQKVNFFPFEISNLSYDKDKNEITFSYKPFLLANENIKENGKKYVYWRYFTAPNDKGEFIRTKTVKLVAN